MGHATVGCLLGHPSTPAISLAGHAWTGIADLRPWLVWLMALAAAAGAGAAATSRCEGTATIVVVRPGRMRAWMWKSAGLTVRVSRILST